MKFSLNYKKKRVLYWVLFFLLFILGLTLIFLPANYFDEGQSVCLSVVLFDVKCYGCGMTRAVQHLIHLDFEGAYNFNKLVIFVFPLLVFMILKEFYSFVKNKKK